MSQVIRISDELYRRLGKHASGFDSPSRVIERILDAYENDMEVPHLDVGEVENREGIEPATHLEIVYVGGSEEVFKQILLREKQAFLKLYYTDGTDEIKHWNASKFKASSSVKGNLASGYLRGWKKRGLYKAKVSISERDLQE